jgi:hypothetical protein
MIKNSRSNNFHGIPTNHITIGRTDRAGTKGTGTFLPVRQRPFSLSIEGDITRTDAIRLASWILRCINELDQASSHV